jgi:diguanylate cyclase (GGDEF)-like protein/PAS domain S-box-containing protein
MNAGTYDQRLVALSVVIAILASYAALDLAGRVTAAEKSRRLMWLLGGATAMGAGIWLMHYIGMLALRMDMPVEYSIPTVLLSLFAAIAASGIALFTVSQPSMGVPQMAFGSVMMGSGIAAMHYIGMAAMRMPATIRYDRRLVGLSVVLAIVISCVALALSFRLRNSYSIGWKIFCAVIMGSAIPLMHYTGMWAANFEPAPMLKLDAFSVGVSSLSMVVVVAGILLLLAFVITTASWDRSIREQQARTDAALSAETYFRTLAEAIPAILWTARADGTVDFHNRRWAEYAGADPAQNAKHNWQSALHKDDIATTIDRWKHAVRTGEPYETQCRLLRTDQTYRWHLVRARAASQEGGGIDRWFGTCTDIDEQKLLSENLQEEVRRRTELVLESNAQLKKEMEGRARTQQELNEQSERLVHELTQRSKDSALFARMGDLLQTCGTVKEAFSIVLGFAPKLFRGLGGAIILLNSSKNLLEVVGTWGKCDLTNSVFDPTSCWALRTGRRYLVDAGDRSAPCGHALELQNSYLCIPMQAHGDSLGVIHFQAIGDRTISEPEGELANKFAEQIGLSIANIRLREALRSQSIRDAVTGLFNRRYLEETLEREISRATRNGQPLGVVMLDLDHFKQFNDTFGHEAGDIVLRAVGSLFSKGTRVDDIACRYGGEEFVLILPTSNLKNTQTHAERLRCGAKDLQLTHLGRSLGVVTLSAGVAVFPTDGITPAQLMEKADAALYRAKKSGRDRVVVSSETASAEHTSEADVTYKA